MSERDSGKKSTTHCQPLLPLASQCTHLNEKYVEIYLISLCSIPNLKEYI